VVRAGANTLEVKVVNLWQPSDRRRAVAGRQSRKKDGRTLDQWPDWLLAGKPSPTGRFAFTSHRLWKKDDSLVPSGLLGPVTLQVSELVRLTE
jgi:hypothetical protein